MLKSKKILTAVVALAMVFSFAFAVSATFADTTMAGATTYNFQTDLKLGSSGTTVVSLQSLLVSQGYLVIPVGVTPGYFGGLTKAAVVKWQAANGLPATGFFGPLSRGKVNGANIAIGGGATVPNTQALCPNGMTLASNCTALPSSTTNQALCPNGKTIASNCVASPSTTTTTGSNGITTVGVEGTIIVTQESAGIKTSVYEGETMDSVLGFRVEAKTSDALVQRVKVIIGTSTNAYTKVFRKISLTDASGNVLASKDLNSGTVDRDTSTQYSVTLSGFSALVKKDTKASFYIKADIMGSVSLEYRGTQTLTLPVNGVRAQDGAGLDQYSSSQISQNVTVSRSLSDSATLTLSTDPDVVKSQTIVANIGSNNDEADKVTVGSFRALAEKDGVLVRDITVTASSTAGAATQPTAYLYDGSNQIASASGINVGTSTTYTFTSIDQIIAKDTTKTYTIKVDVRSATTVADIFRIAAVSVASAESATTGSSLTVNSLSTVGNDLTFVSKGVITTLASTPSIIINTTKDTNGSTTEAHLASTFNVNLNAIGADAVFNGTSTAFAFRIYRGSTDVTSALAAYTTVEYNQNSLPQGFTASSTGSGFTVPRNNSGTVPVPVTLRVDVVGASNVSSVFPNTGSYSVRLSTITYVSGGSSVTNDNSTNQAYVTAPAQRP